MSMDAFMAGSFQHSTKPDGTPTVRTEVAIEDEVRRVLARHRPGDGFLGEEGGQSGDASTCWIVDPIDGTGVFITGGRAWGTQIALQLDGDLAVGVASAPALGRRWWSAIGQGAWTSSNKFGKRPLTVSTADNRNRVKWSVIHHSMQSVKTGIGWLPDFRPLATTSPRIRMPS